jgi:antitoxin HicB
MIADEDRRLVRHLQITESLVRLPHMTHQETITTYEYTYTCVFDPEPEGGFTVTCPALPGLVTYGATLEEARAMAVEAIEGYLESLQKDGLPLPISEDERRNSRREPITVKLATV